MLNLTEAQLAAIKARQATARTVSPLSEREAAEERLRDHADKRAEAKASKITSWQRAIRSFAPEPESAQERAGAIPAFVPAGMPLNAFERAAAKARERNAARLATNPRMGRPEKRKSTQTGPPEPTEHDIQVALLQWWDRWCRTKGLDERLLFAIPNAGAGGSRGQAGKMKAEGTRPGVPDLMLALPCRAFPGMFLELKRGGSKPGKPSSDQASYHALLRSLGWNVICAIGFDEAERALRAYVERAIAPAPKPA